MVVTISCVQQNLYEIMLRSLQVAALLTLLWSQGAVGADPSSAAHPLPSTDRTTTTSAATDGLLDFRAWRALYRPASYATSAEGRLREEIFLANAATVQRHNQAYAQGATLFAMTLENPFADWTAAEFAAAYLMDSQNCSATHTSSGPLDERLRGTFDDLTASAVLPTSVDWRTRGIVTPVKNQANCGSCWTFSTSGTLEAHTCLHQDQPGGASLDCTHWTGLAEQQLLDCAGNYDNHGCNGGLPSHAYEYLKDAGGMATEDAYPYRGNDDGPCAVADGASWGAQVAEVYNITAFDEDDLVSAIARVGPVSIAYQVSPDFRFYSHGVYDSYNATTHETMCRSGPQDVNHAVVAVGYGQTAATADQAAVPYYIVRNSWSATWGMEGYFWMKRNGNMCGVSDCASFPIVPNSPLARSRPEAA
jgi:cathepsin H